jgi:hypothetical protein
MKEGGKHGGGEAFWVVQPELEGEVLFSPTGDYDFCPAKFAKIFKFWEASSRLRCLRRAAAAEACFCADSSEARLQLQ